MKFSPVGEALTKGFEALRLTPYRDLGGVWTCGWGHVGKDVIPGQPWTLEQAETAFLVDTAGAVAAVNRGVHVPLTQNQFDALVDFAFNVGPHAFSSSSMLKYLNAGASNAAAIALLKWNKVIVGGVVQISAGLSRRRAAENALFLKA